MHANLVISLYANIVVRIFRTLLAGMRRIGILTMRNIYQLAIIKFLLPLPQIFFIHSLSYIVGTFSFQYGNIIGQSIHCAKFCTTPSPCMLRCYYFYVYGLLLFGLMKVIDHIRAHFSLHCIKLFIISDHWFLFGTNCIKMKKNYLVIFYNHRTSY